MFTSNLNEISRGKYKSYGQKSALENTKLLYESREAVTKLFNDYSSIVSEAKYKTIHGKGRHSDLARVPKVSNHKAFDYMRLRILIPKQMIQRLQIALAQVKAGNTSENLLNEIKQIIYSLSRAKEITKKVYKNIMNPTKL